MRTYSESSTSIRLSRSILIAYTAIPTISVTAGSTRVSRRDQKLDPVAVAHVDRPVEALLLPEDRPLLRRGLAAEDPGRDVARQDLREEEDERGDREQRDEREREAGDGQPEDHVRDDGARAARGG